MADDPLELEARISAITDQIKELLKDRNELRPLDMEKNRRIQAKISRLHGVRDQLKGLLKIALTEFEG